MDNSERPSAGRRRQGVSGGQLLQVRRAQRLLRLRQSQQRGIELHEGCIHGGVLLGVLVAGAYLHDFVLGPGLAGQIREGKPQSLRPILTAIGRANLLVTLALPVLGALLSEFLRD